MIANGVIDQGDDLNHVIIANKQNVWTREMQQ